ncbi:MAG TPA: O-antigen ligase family protein [Verrucomicrobiae bacterium]
MGGTMLLLLVPFMLTGHHSFLILSWNAFILVYFLPGKPYLWMLMTAISLLFLIVTKTLNRNSIRLIWVPQVAWPLLAIGLITFITAQLTGGVGIRAVGSDTYGGKRYVFLWAAIAGFFAISAIPVDPRKRLYLAGGFYLLGITAFFSNLAYILGEAFYFLFLLFPVDWAITQLGSEAVVGYSRIGGLSPASLAFFSFLLMHYGLRGILDFKKPWRALLLAATVALGLFSGFRATIVLVALFFTVQFLLEGLHKTKFLLIAVLFGVLLAASVLPFANRLPLAVQRCLTVLPLQLDPAAEEDARGSTDWRFEIWRSVWPDVPKYLLLGKGYSLDPKDMYFAQTHISRRIDVGYEGAVVAGDYHNGPLSIVIPFGIWGVLAFAAFIIGSLKVLWRNYKFGDPEIENINRFNLTAFIVQLIFFIFVFGAFYLDLAKFVGIVALSISLNRGMAGPVTAPAKALADTESEPEEALVGGRLEPAFRGGARA